MCKLFKKYFKKTKKKDQDTFMADRRQKAFDRLQKVLESEGYVIITQEEYDKLTNK